MNYLYNLREITYALSEALDYVGIDDTMHGKRVAYMSAEVATKLGWSKERIDHIIMMGMLHDCGVSSTDVHHSLVTELDWDNAQIHCDRGEWLLNKVSEYRQYSQTILYHHTHWNKLPESIDQKTKEDANLLYLTDRVDALRAIYGSQTHKERNIIRDVIKKYSGEMFSPELVNAFLKTSEADSFWYFFDMESLIAYFNEWIADGLDIETEYSFLRAVAVMFANIVDAKSTYTAKHTYGVAAMSLFVAKEYGLTEAQQEKTELAAFFHDLGKLRVADSILNKNGPLDDEERTQMNRHGFDSNVILRKIKGFHEIARIASMHHETLDAKGYPYNLSAEQIPIEARILAISDIFQALVQDRPYRAGLNKEDALAILESMCEEYKLDSSVVNIVRQNLKVCYSKAMCSE